LYLMKRPGGLNRWRILAIFLTGAYLLSSLPETSLRGAPRLAAPDNPPTADKVGAIEGDAISVEGPMSVDVVHGQVKTVLRSGSDVHVKAGQARIELVEGGHITICGPAHFSVLKSGGSLTLALEGGSIHAFLQSEPALTVYTPQIQARPISIGNGPMEALVGLDSSGAMCIRATKGAVRIEQQLTGQSMLVPQNGDVSLTNGQLETLHTTTTHCLCEDIPSLSSPAPGTEVSTLASTEELKKREAERKPTPETTPPAATEKPEPVYQVFMPPLHYDATKKVAEDFDPDLIVLVRRVHVRPTLIFQGKVEGDPVVAQATPGPAEPPKPTTEKPKNSDDTTWNRVRNYVKKLWSPSSKHITRTKVNV
jgi:hypothetical protein